MHPNPLYCKLCIVALLVLMLAFVGITDIFSTSGAQSQTDTSSHTTNSHLTQLPAYFIPAPNKHAFQANLGSLNVNLDRHQITVQTQESKFYIRFVGANPQLEFMGQDPTRARTHHFIGNDPAEWQQNLPTYASILYHNLYPGIDLTYTVNEGQLLKSEFRIQPASNLNQIAVTYKNITALTLNADGELRIELSPEEILYEHIPYAYQEINGQHIPVKIGFRLIDNTTYTFFSDDDIDPSQPLVIDPTLFYATYLGGIGDDEGWAVASDKDNNTLIAGITNSVCFSEDDTQITKTQKDVFVAKLDKNGELVYITFFGGGSSEEGNSIGVDDAGNAYVAGETFSEDFPVHNAWQPDFGGDEDAYVLKLAPDGTLVYSTFIGGSESEEINDIFVDAVGNTYVGGEVYSDDYPLMNPLPMMATYGMEDEDGFISIFDPEGRLVYSTYISARRRDQIFRLTVDDEGHIYAVGMTSSENFLTVNAAQSKYGGGWEDCIVLKLDPWNNEILFSTFLGGSDRDACWGIDVDSEGNSYVTGYSQSEDFPLVDALQPCQGNGIKDIIVTKLSPHGDLLLLSTCLGGCRSDYGTDLTLDSGDNVYVVGTTQSPDFQQVNALQANYGGGVSDGFLLQFSSQEALDYASFLGGSGADQIFGVTVGPDWIVHLTGGTDSQNLQLSRAAQGKINGGTDAFVARFGIVPTPTPPPTPTPTPTPTPFASEVIGPEGGGLWIAYPNHLTLLSIPEKVLSSQTPITLTYESIPNPQGELRGMNHFFSIYAELKSSSTWLPIRFQKPVQLILGYRETNGIILDTLNLYRLTAQGWATDSITKVQESPGYMIADIQWMGVYGLMGKTNYTYLPVILRCTP